MAAVAVSTVLVAVHATAVCAVLAVLVAHVSAVHATAVCTVAATATTSHAGRSRVLLLGGRRRRVH
jgi:hypothetical protein